MAMGAGVGQGVGVGADSLSFAGKLRKAST